MSISMSISISAKADISPGGSSFDPSAQAFIDEALITDTTQQDAINTLVVGLKDEGLWDKMIVIYPVVGGTASQHKYNLKDPRDSSDAFTLAFSGGITHSTNGMLPNGTNGFANTNFTPSAHIADPDSFHFSVYSRTNTLPTAPSFDIGANIITGNNDDGFSDAETHSFYYMNYFGFTSLRHGQYVSIVNYLDNNSLGLYVANRNLSNNVTSYKNGILKATGPTSPSGLAYSPMYLLGLNEFYPDVPFYNTYYGKRQIAFATIGSGLSDNDSNRLYNQIQAFQTTLGRQV